MHLTSCGKRDSINLVQGPPNELHSSDDEIVPSFQESFVDALAQATENIQIASQGMMNITNCMNSLEYNF